MSAREAIGGYFAIELGAGSAERYGAARKYQSGRAALLALLRAQRPARVWMPWYICDSMLEPLRMAGVAVQRYGVDESLAPRDLDVQPRDWLLYVNYFGLCDANVDELLQRVPRHQVIVDNAQAYYSPPRDCLAAIYSPRKFFGLPDGGYLCTSLAVPSPERVDDGSVARSAHLLLRAAHGPEAGYASFVAAEQTLAMQEPMAMSPLTVALLAGIDQDAACARRRRNFAQLHAALGAHNQLRLELNDAAAPLCYPYRSRRAGLREQLIAARIFVPTYWPDMSDDAPALERSLRQEIVPLPCDQRYAAEHMKTIVSVVAQAGG